jgi:hypothetical protein
VTKKGAFNEPRGTGIDAFGGIDIYLLIYCLTKRRTTTVSEIVAVNE